jgi:glycosyltransferase involved in cell wall biosynthesis
MAGSKDDPDITVLIATHNRAEMLKRAIQSVWNHTGQASCAARSV